MDRLFAMQVFVDTVELGSLTAAAGKLDVSRAMATRYIAALESAFGVRLLHRTNRNLGLTAAGANILPHCRQILSITDDIAAVSSSTAAAPSGLIRVSSSISFGQIYLADALRRYSALYPNVSVHLMVTDRPVQLAEERIDLALQVGDRNDPALISRLLTLCRSTVCAAPSYLAQRGIPASPEDLVAHNCLNTTYLGDVWQFRYGAEDVDRSVRVSGGFSANDVTMLLDAAVAGDGVVYLPDIVVENAIKSGQLVHLLDSFKTAEFGIYAFYLCRKHIPAATRALIDFLARDINDQRTH